MKTKFCVVWAIVLLEPAPALASRGPVVAWGDNGRGQSDVPGVWPGASLESRLERLRTCRSTRLL